MWKRRVASGLYWLRTKSPECTECKCGWAWIGRCVQGSCCCDSEPNHQNCIGGVVSVASMQLLLRFSFCNRDSVRAPWRTRFIGWEPNHQKSLRIRIDRHGLVIGFKAMVVAILILQFGFYEGFGRTRSIGLSRITKKSSEGLQDGFRMPLILRWGRGTCPW